VRFWSHAYRVLYNLRSALSTQAISSVRTCNKAGCQWIAHTTLGEVGRGRRPDGLNDVHGKAISVSWQHWTVAVIANARGVCWPRKQHESGDQTPLCQRCPSRSWSPARQAQCCYVINACSIETHIRCLPAAAMDAAHICYFALIYVSPTRPCQLHRSGAGRHKGALWTTATFDAGTIGGRVNDLWRWAQTNAIHANHSAFGGIIPHFRHFSAIPRGICEILLFHVFNITLLFCWINSFRTSLNLIIAHIGHVQWWVLIVVTWCQQQKQVNNIVFCVKVN